MMLTGMGMLSVGTALAQNYNPNPPDGSFVNDNNTIVGEFQCDTDGDGVNDAPATANGVCDIPVGDDDLDNKNVGGNLQSTLVVLPVTKAVNDKVTFNNVKLPADFARNANHTITIVDQANGQIVARKTFGVSANGSITAPIPSSGSNLPKTGTDYIDPALKVGGALLVMGGAIVLVARRRKDSTTTAAA